MIHEALYFDLLENQAVKCRLCPAECRLKPGRRGICRSRFNLDGVLKTDNFGEAVTIALDPIEKKPLYHFFPGSEIVSLGPNCCNLNCMNCQNWQISQETANTFYIAPDQLPGVVSQYDSIGVAYTYTEPMMWYEYILEAGSAIHEAGLVNVAVSNGYINPEPLKRLLPFIDAFNIDLKGMRPEFYRRVCKGKLDPVLDVIRIIADSPSHLEITNLIIPGLNDTDDDFHKLAGFVASVDRTIPLHLSAYHPSYKMDAPATRPDSILVAHAIAREYLDFVYVGNVAIEGYSNTICSSCGTILAKRTWRHTTLPGVTDLGTCAACGEPAPFILAGDFERNRA